MTRSVNERLRLSGIDVVGEIPWGTHICQFYESVENLTSVLVPYFQAGLENNEMCIWVTAEPLRVAAAKKALKLAVDNLEYCESNNQMKIFDYLEFYHGTGVFDSFATIQQLLESEKIARESNFTGVRISGNVSWLDQKEWVDFIDYESIVDASIRGHRIIAICSYPLQRHQPTEIVDIVSNHRNILLQRRERLEYISNNGYGYIARLRRSGFNYAEIGRIMGISRQRVAQILKKEIESRDKEQHRRSIEFLTTSEAADFLNVHINTIRRWCDSGVLPGYRIGQRNDRRFRRIDLEKFLSNINTINTSLP